ncbi:MAG: hypothetical protein ACK5M1_10595 [Xanthomarina gelatinilytica]|uniref:hypothetical protein n=1 Tax=Xanthomarina gelatinilytica TaxID=1137281 RepID=UPI003A87F79D
MKFENESHFKNYVRKIAESCGYEKYEFDQSNLPSSLINMYQFQSENELELSAIGAASITDHLIKELKQLYYCDESQKMNLFLNIYSEVRDIYEQAIIVCKQIKLESIKDGFNLSNYFDNEFLKPYAKLQQYVKNNNKFSYLNENEFIPSTKFKEFVENHIGKFGIYFLYDENKTLMYIGKSTSIGDRILNSIRDRQITGYIKVALTKTTADIHICEPYYILKENPFYNVEFKASDNLSFELKPLKKSKLIKILTKN